MRKPLLALTAAALSLAWLVFFGLGSRPADLNAALLLLGATALFYWTFRTGQKPPRLPRWHIIALWALPAYAAFQLIPLPSPLLGLLSPGRALLTDSLGGVVANLNPAPISVQPAFAVFAFFGLLGYLIIFSLLRDIGWRFIEIRPWIPAAPLAAIATIQAAIGLIQWLGGTRNTRSLGTFANSENLAAFLNIALPFTLVFGFLSLRRYQTQESPSSKPALYAAFSWLASLLLLLALFHESSNVSRVVVAGSLFVLVTLITVPQLKTKQLRWCGAGIAGAVGFLGLLFIAPPLDLAESLAHFGPDDRAETTLTIWNNATTLLGDYRWFGTGPGGFESTFLKYQGSRNLTTMRNPGNDVLLILITYGIVGFVILIVALLGILRPAVNGAICLRDEPRRLLAAAITASFVAVLFRSVFESSLSVPAVAMAFAWVAGLSQSSGPD